MKELAVSILLECIFVNFFCSTWVEYTCDLLVQRFSEALHDNSATSVLQVCTVSISLTYLSPILSVLYNVTVGTMLHNNDNYEHGTKSITCKQAFPFKSNASSLVIVEH